MFKLSVCILCVLDRASSWYLNKGRPTLMTLALLCQFTAQHVLDVNTSIFRSLRLLGALLCRLYCGKCKLQNILSSLYYKFSYHFFYASHRTAVRWLAWKKWYWHNKASVIKVGLPLFKCVCVIYMHVSTCLVKSSDVHKLSNAKSQMCHLPVHVIQPSH